MSRYFWTPRQLNILTEVKLSIYKLKRCSCFNLMGQNINKKQKLWATPYLQSRFFCNIVTCMDTYIWQFPMLTGV